MRQVLDQFQITAFPQNAAIARDRVKVTAEAIGFSGSPLGELEVAVGEAVTNAILYGSIDDDNTVTVRCYLEELVNLFSVEITDKGNGFDPDHVRQAENEDALGGRGLRLMRVLTDRLLLYYDENGMNVCLSKRIPTAIPGELA